MNECVKCVTSQYKCVEDDFEMAIDSASDIKVGWFNLLSN